MTITTDFECNFRAYFALYDGTVLELGEAEAKLVNGLFHDNASIVDGGERKYVSKDMIFKIVETLLKAARKVEVVEFKFLDDAHVEYQLRVSGKSVVPTLDHYIGTIKDEKLYEVKPFDESSNKRVITDIAMEMKFREYMAIFDGIPREFGVEDESLFDNLFRDEITVVAGETTVVKRPQILRFVKASIQDGKKNIGLEFKTLDESNFEYKADFIHQGNIKVDHSIATIQNGKITKISCFDVQKAQKVMFEMRFREYFCLYNGVPKEFGQQEKQIFDRLYDDEFSFINGKVTLDKTSWMKSVSAFIESGVKVEILDFKFNDDIHYEYKLRVVGEGFDQELHSTGIITSTGKCRFLETIKEQPYRELMDHYKSKSESVNKQEDGISESSYDFKVDNKENKLTNA